jgi:hypothetical protein
MNYMSSIHAHQHRLDRSYNILLLLIPGLIFMVVIGVYLILRVQEDAVIRSEAEAQSILDKPPVSY